MRSGDRSKPRRIVARYAYSDEKGKVLYYVWRHEPKDFSVRSMAGKSLLQGERYRRVPYRLVELLAADPAEPVFIVEGEKDVDRLWAEGLVATCNAFGGGPGKWTRGHSRYLRGRDVVVLPDNDPTGAEHGRAVAKALHRIARSVRLLNLPRLPQTGDVSNWLDSGRTVEDLMTLVGGTPRWKLGRDGDRLPEPKLIDRYGREFDSMRDARRMRRAIYGLVISPSEKLLLIILTEVSAPQDDLAAYLRVTPRRVRQMTASMVGRGILSVRKSGRRNRYQIDPDGTPKSK